MLCGKPQRELSPPCGGRPGQLLCGTWAASRKAPAWCFIDDRLFVIVKMLSSATLQNQPVCPFPPPSTWMVFWGGGEGGPSKQSQFRTSLTVCVGPKAKTICGTLLSLPGEVRDLKLEVPSSGVWDALELVFNMNHILDLYTIYTSRSGVLWYKGRQMQIFKMVFSAAPWPSWSCVMWGLKARSPTIA